jgi:excinuclease UvrABC ATPase subunit
MNVSPYLLVAKWENLGDFLREWLGIWLMRVLTFEISYPYKDFRVAEHNLDVIRCSDWIIELGPEGGDKGGEIVVCGTPETVAEHPSSYTGRCLKQVLEQHLPLV